MTKQKVAFFPHLLFALLLGSLLLFSACGEDAPMEQPEQSAEGEAAGSPG